MNRGLSCAAVALAATLAACSEFGGSDPGGSPPGPIDSPQDGGAPPVGGPASRGITLAVGESTNTVYLVQGGAVTVPVKIQRRLSSTGAVAITVGKLPAGASADPLVIPARMTDAVLTLHAAAATPQGAVSLDVNATETEDASSSRAQLSTFVRGRPGALDTTFGEEGIVKTVFAAPTSAAHDARVLQSGAIVVAGRRTNNLALARLTAAGAVDTSFTGGGRTNLAVSQGDIVVDLVQGKMPADGFIHALGRDPLAATLFRTKLDGNPEPSFNGNGRTLVDLGRGSTRGINVISLTDGNALVLTHHSASKVVVVSRWKADGTLDTAYGTSGACELTASGTDSEITGAGGMLLRSDGSVHVVLGLASTQAVIKGCSATGQLDTTLGTAPDHFLPAPGGGVPARSSDGGIVLLGTASWTRMNAALVSDTSIGTFGRVSTAPITETRSLLTQPDGGVLIAGDVVDSPGDFTVIRFKPGGSLDPDFGSAGVAKLKISSSLAFVSKLVAQPDGRILVVGRQEDDFDGVVARIWP